MMVRTLLKKQLLEMFRGFYIDQRKNKARSKAATIAYIVFYVLLMVVLLGGMFAAMSYSLCRPLAEADQLWLYFLIMGTIAIVFGVFGSVFSTYSGLYLAKDNDLLLSMPIKIGTVMLSRLLGVYIIGLMYSSVVLLPALIVELAVLPFSPSRLIGALVFLILISVFIFTLSCLLGWVVAKISLKLKNRAIITVLVSLIFVGVYYVVYFKALDLISALIANAVSYGERIRGVSQALYIFGRAGEGDWMAMLICTLFVAALFGAMWYLLSRSFITIATSTAPVKTHAAARPGRQHSAPTALLGKEFSRLTASPNYMLNCALGVLVIPAAGVLMLVRGGALLDVLSSVFAAKSGSVSIICCAALCMFSSMNATAVPSVSLEGSNLWIAKSLPVPAWEPLRAKLRVQLILTLPSLLFCSVCFAIVLRAPLAETALLIALPQIFALFSAYFALWLDLRRPNLSWTNEIIPIKQGMNMLTYILGLWLVCAVIGLVYLILPLPFGAAVYMLLLAGLFGSLSLLLRSWIRRRGTAIFSDL